MSDTIPCKTSAMRQASPQSNDKQKQQAQATRTRKSTKITRRAQRAPRYELCTKDCSIVCYDVTAPNQRKTPISARKIYVQPFTRLIEIAHSQKRMGNFDCSETPQHTTADAQSRLGAPNLATERAAWRHSSTPPL